MPSYNNKTDKEREKRYELRSGKFGTYLYDNENSKSMDLQEILILNQEVTNAEICYIDDNIRSITTDIKSMKHTLLKLNKRGESNVKH